MEDVKKDYHKIFVEKHADMINETRVCTVCGGKYQYFNKSRHNKTKKHLLFQQYKNITDEKDKIIFAYQNNLKLPKECGKI